MGVVGVVGVVVIVELPPQPTRIALENTIKEVLISNPGPRNPGPRNDLKSERISSNPNSQRMIADTRNPKERRGRIPEHRTSSLQTMPWDWPLCNTDSTLKRSEIALLVIRRVNRLQRL